MSECIGSATTGRIFVEFGISFILNLSTIQILLKSDKTLTVHEDLSGVYCCRWYKVAMKTLSFIELLSGY
jgi:hypothetical protein